MERRMDNELEPLNIVQKKFWEIAINTLSKNPDKLLPVYLEIPEITRPIGNYFLHLIEEDEFVFIQAEGFNSREFEDGFILGSDKEWQQIQPGIYRLDVTDEIRNDLDNPISF
jgi:hypothetical protein